MFKLSDLFWLFAISFVAFGIDRHQFEGKYSKTISEKVSSSIQVVRSRIQKSKMHTTPEDNLPTPEIGSTSQSVAPAAPAATKSIYDTSKKYVLVSAGSIREIHPAELEDPARVKDLESRGKIREAGDPEQAREISEIKEKLPAGASLLGGSDISAQIQKAQKAANDHHKALQELENTPLVPESVH